jgi:hypothetical protein
MVFVTEGVVGVSAVVCADELAVNVDMGPAVSSEAAEATAAASVTAKAM